MSVICARISGVLRSSCICWAVKLTTKDTKDTENFALFFRSAGRLRSGERGLLARSARQLAEHKFPSAVCRRLQAGSLRSPERESERQMRNSVFSRLRCVVLLMMRFLFVASALLYASCGRADTQVADFPAQRERMVKEQIVMRSVVEERVLAAMRKVPREEFVPVEFRAESYTDRPLPIGYDQTISQPFIVAFMTEALRPQPTDRVLEIGTGSGYQAAILAELVDEVYSIEIIEPLAKNAEATLQRHGYKNVHVKAGDGYKGWPEHAPFDSIIVTCAPERVPQPLIDQLKEGGRMRSEEHTS